MKRKPANKETSITRSSAAEYLTFVTAKGEGGVEAIYADEDVWLSQKMMAVLYDVDVRTINYHLQKVFKDSELEKKSVTLLGWVGLNDRRALKISEAVSGCAGLNR